MTPAWIYDLALCFHLLGAFSLVSGTVVAGVSFEAARRRTSCAEIAVLLGLARIGAVLVVAGTLFAAGFGLWLVDLGHWSYGTPWVDAAIGLLVAVAVARSIGAQRPKRARVLATRLAAEAIPRAPSCAPLSTTARRPFSTTWPPRPSSSSSSSWWSSPARLTSSRRGDLPTPTVEETLLHAVGGSPAAMSYGHD